VQYVRADAHFVRARTALASAADPAVGPARRAEARKLGLVAKATDAMTSQGIRVPVRFANMMLPGRWRQ
jgi:hypothetical protein